MFLQASYSYEIVLYSQKTRSVENPFIQILHHKIHLTKPATRQLSLHLQPPNVWNPPTHVLGITSTFPALVKAKLVPISLGDTNSSLAVAFFICLFLPLKEKRSEI